MSNVYETGARGAGQAFDDRAVLAGVGVFATERLRSADRAQVAIFVFQLRAFVALRAHFCVVGEGAVLVRGRVNGLLNYRGVADTGLVDRVVRDSFRILDVLVVGGELTQVVAVFRGRFAM